MLRLRENLMPLISVVIAFVPQSSCEELLALHRAGRVEAVSDHGDGEVEISESGSITYKYLDENGEEKKVECQAFIDCSGQRHLCINEFPFTTLVENGTVSEARLEFRSAKAALELKPKLKDDIYEVDGKFFLRVPGVRITDDFQLVDRNGTSSERIYMMAVPYIGGFNPDYSGLDFCEHASELIVDHIMDPAKHVALANVESR